MKKTVVLGASPNPTRYSYVAVLRLLDKGHEVIPIGLREGNIEGKNIVTTLSPITDVDTVTLYVGARNQTHYYNYILGLNPQRLIFNPGAENPELAKLAKNQGISVVNACTLVMLSVGNY